MAEAGARRRPPQKSNIYAITPLTSPRHWAYGANVAAALKVAKQLPPGAAVVTVLPDTGERYLSSGLFNKKKEEEP